MAAEIGSSCRRRPRVDRGSRRRQLRRDLAAALRRAHRSMLSVFNFFQTFGFYGFATWVPTLLIAKGITITTQPAIFVHHRHRHSGRAAARHADRRPDGAQVADRAAAPSDRRVWHAVRQSRRTSALIVLGVLVTLCNNWMSFSFHSYQSELFPTRIRARADRLRVFLEPVVGGVVRVGGGVSVEPRRGERGIHLHRLRDADRGGVDRRIRTEDTRAGAGGDFQRLRRSLWAGQSGGMRSAFPPYVLSRRPKVTKEG